MASAPRRSTSSSGALAKRPAAASEQGVKPVAAPKKRVALGNLTNQGVAGRGAAPANIAKGPQPRSASKTLVTRGTVTRAQDASSRRSSLVTSSSVKPKSVVIQKAVEPIIASDESIASVIGQIAPCSSALSPSRSAGGSVSMDETMSMSTCDSMKSPNIEYLDNADSSVMASLERRACDNLRICEHSGEDIPGFTWKREVLTGMRALDNIVNVDTNHQDPQFCATLAFDIYKHLKTAETKKRPSADFMEVVQKDINESMRAILIDWLVEVAEEYRLVPDTLYLTVNYLDRYLSGNEVTRQRLQLLGVACMLIASKYEEICAPQVEEFCYITDNTYFRDEVLQMEASVLKYLKFEMTAPTIKCFLRRFVRVAQQPDETTSLQLEFLASYIAELTLLEYNFLHYPASITAASAVFLAKFILQPSIRPWNATLGHYTSYKPSDLHECIRALHHLFCNSPNKTLPAIREKYSQHKYKFVAAKYCPPSIPQQFFEDAISQQ